MDRKAIKDEITALNALVLKLKADQNRLSAERAPFFQPVPNSGTLDWQAKERERRESEAAKLTKQIDTLMHEMRDVNQKLLVANERLSLAKDEPAKQSKLEAELAQLRESRAGAVEIRDQLKVQAGSHALAAARGDVEAEAIIENLEGEALDSERRILIFDRAIADVEAKITEAKREFLERGADERFKRAREIAAELVQDAAIADAAIATYVATLRGMKQKRAALMATSSIASERANAIVSASAVARSMVAAGLSDFTQVDSPRDKGELLANSVSTLTQFIVRPNVSAAA